MFLKIHERKCKERKLEEKETQQNYSLFFYTPEVIGVLKCVYE